MSTRGRTLRLATRGSDLARRQAATVKATLEDHRHTVELVEVETTGDQIQDELIHRLGKTGAFVRSLDQQVLDGDLDGAIHSMKDMPTDQPDDLVVAGVPERAPAEDILVTPDGSDLADLPDGATVGTSSLRRKAQLLAERPDLEIEPLRGNVDTRLEKLLAPHLQAEHEQRLAAAGELEAEEANETYDDEDLPAFERSIEDWFDGLAEIERRAMERDVDTEYDAIVLAKAGLDRAGLLHHAPHQTLPRDRFVPSPGQGALAVTSLDGEVADLLSGALDEPRTRAETTVERTVLDELGGGCIAPIGVHAVLQGAVVHTVVRVLSQDGSEEVAAVRDLPADHHRRAAREFARDLADQGAADLIEQARRDEPDDAKREET
jgi:hydroxymethylbilane synthase